MARPGPIVVERGLIRSRAFLSLKTRGSAQALLLFLSKRKMIRVGKKKSWMCANNGELTFTFSEALKHGWGKKRFSLIRRELLEKGFIDIEEPGGAYGKDPTKFRLSERWRDFGTDHFVKSEWPEDGLERGYRRRKRDFLTTQNETPTSSQNETPGSTKRGFGVSERYP